MSSGSYKAHHPEEKPEQVNKESSSSAPGDLFISQPSPRAPDIAHDLLKFASDCMFRLPPTSPTCSSITTENSSLDELNASEYVATPAAIYSAQMCGLKATAGNQAAEHICWPIALANVPDIEAPVSNIHMSSLTAGYGVFANAGAHLGAENVYAHSGNVLIPNISAILPHTSW
jgi:hypothetical protein